MGCGGFEENREHCVGYLEVRLFKTWYKHVIYNKTAHIESTARSTSLMLSAVAGCRQGILLTNPDASKMLKSPGSRRNIVSVCFRNRYKNRTNRKLEGVSRLSDFPGSLSVKYKVNNLIDFIQNRLPCSWSCFPIVPCVTNSGALKGAWPLYKLKLLNLFLLVLPF